MGSDLNASYIQLLQDITSASEVTQKSSVIDSFAAQNQQLRAAVIIKLRDLGGISDPEFSRLLLHSNQQPGGTHTTADDTGCARRTLLLPGVCTIAIAWHTPT